MQRILKYSQPARKEGETQTLRHYAIIPRLIDNVLIWLHRYEAIYVWKDEKIVGIVEDKAVQFAIKGHWVKVSERVL